MDLYTPREIQLQLATKFKAKRLHCNHSRATAALRSGVPEPTLKRFESTGEISLRQFMQLVGAYGVLENADQVFPKITPADIDSLFNDDKAMRKRGRN